MKTTLFFLLFIFCATVYAQNRISDIIGTWRLVKSIHGGKAEDMNEIIKIKHINKSNFTWISCYKDTKVIRNAMSGECNYDGEIYTEKVNYVGVGMVRYLNVVNKFRVEVKGNKLYLKGTLPDKIYIDEIWLKLDK